MWPTEDSTTYSSPKKREIVRAFAGDSTMTREVAIEIRGTQRPHRRAEGCGADADSAGR